MSFIVNYKSEDMPVHVTFQCSLKVKDGKYKYEFSNFHVDKFWTNNDCGILTSSVDPTIEWKWMANKKLRQQFYDDTKKDVSGNISMLVASLKKQMAKNTEW